MNNYILAFYEIAIAKIKASVENKKNAQSNQKSVVRMLVPDPSGTAISYHRQTSCGWKNKKIVGDDLKSTDLPRRHGEKEIA